jgi:hypothetical protein
MQTLHLRFRALRAISLRLRPSRWPTPSLRSASTWETASPLPNPLGPTLAVGLPSAAMRCGMKGLPDLSNSPGPTSAVGPHPETPRQQSVPCPSARAGLPLASPFREPRVVGPVDANTSQVCPRQTARHLSPYPAPHIAGDLGIDDGQARASTTLRAASPELSFPLRPQPYDGRACGEKTVVRHTDSSGTLRSEATGLRPTGRLKAGLPTRVSNQPSASSCAKAPSLVTGQETGGNVMPRALSSQRLRLCSEVR